MSNQRTSIRIRGGADPARVSAIVAAVQVFLDEEATARAKPAGRPEPNRWVMSGRYGSVDPPRPASGPSHYSDPLAG
ncbi:MAG: hypothetical protein OEO77_15070 [Acidimicrobiia bacterium]|nr:hypothetical protein [Acidimicrobiia bacterium]